MKDLPADQRPREKLLARGPASLADAELLALLLRTGVQGQSVLELAALLLRQSGGFAGLLNQPPQALARVKGLGPAKRAELLAVAEIARRALAQQLAAAPLFENPQQVKDYVALALAGREREVFLVLFLDTRHRLLAAEELFSGTLSQTQVHAREVVRRAMLLNAGAVLVAHNHPSGMAEPSRADEFLTQHLKQALALVEVRLLDHLVVGQGQVVSLAERGLL